MSVRAVSRRATLGQRVAVRMQLLGARLRDRADDGMTTAEYAVGTLAAVAFAGLLFALMSSGEVKGMLMSLVSAALKMPKA
ncbi:MAG: DUF4244 domain-containing protein [Dermatophilus congolensis]|nr:DUF4244 domain-containing protein [Dermatophilus congolensis]